AIVEDTQFWAQVRRTCSHLHPLVIAANITQASTTRLDHVLTTLGNLFRIYSDAQLEDAVRTKVLASLEKRWAAADQDPFIAAVILNPYLRGKCFSRANALLTPIGLCNMLKHLHLRVFGLAVDSQFQSAFMDYYNGREEFSNVFLSLEAWEDMAKAQNRNVSPVEVWEGINTNKKVGRNRLVKLAMHILSVIANSAGCERAFSHMGLVQTATRSKLSIDKVHKTTIVGMDIKRSNIEAGLVHTQERRDFSMPETRNSLSHVAELSELDTDEVLDFDQLVGQLIEDATEDTDELDTDDKPPHIPLTIRLPLQAIQSALQDSETPPVAATKISLKLLFIFPQDLSTPSEMAYFWKGGIQNLDKEMEVHDMACSHPGEGDSETADLQYI
ncbi:ribonuclease H-like domain-containing protein, partial [Lactarius quietus]